MMLRLKTWPWAAWSASTRLQSIKHVHEVAFVSLLLAIYTSVTCAAGDFRNTSRKNVLYIVVDDLRPDLEPYGQGYVHTPNIAALANKSLIFDRAYCQFAFCAPSRSSFMTGRRPDRTECWNFVDNFRETVGQNWTTLPQYFKDNGYFSTGVGKLFHPLLPPNGDPPSWSDFRDFPYINPLYLDCPDFKSWCSLDRAEDAFADGLTVNEALRRMRYAVHNLSQPFFLGVGFHKPHLPFRAPDGFIELYPAAENVTLARNKTWPRNAPTIAWNGCLASPGRYKDITERRDYLTPMSDDEAGYVRRGYYAAVSFTDSLIGQLMSELDALGVANETIISLHGDHGWHLGEHNMWCKMSNFELGVRVPWMVHVPDVERCSGTHTPALAELVDVYPTLAELAGLPLPGDLDGTSQAPVFHADGVSVKNVSLSQFPKCGSNLTHMGTCEHRDKHLLDYMGYTIRTDQYRYTEWFRWNGTELRADLSQAVARELYDHHGDDGTDFDSFENENVAAEQASLADELSAELHRVVTGQRRSF
ncbi:iduronate 2-sulfatase-like [Sycon ciliatum]|uniref:iduronate 2-sulfatase-like n=1 Tax=Sycon ciliatum TaxID=27933 RepID=UPI0031F71D1B